MAIQHDGWSIVAQYRKYGKTGCKVCAESPGHGPYYYGTKAVDGHHRSKYFGKTLPGDGAQDGTQDEVAILRRENDELCALVKPLQERLVADKPSVDLGVETNDSESLRLIAATNPKSGSVDNGELTR